MVSLNNIGIRFQSALFPDHNSIFYRLFQDRAFVNPLLPASYEENWANTQAVFVLSTGRTGTMQLMAVLNLCPEIFAMHEPRPSLVKVAKDAYVDGCTENKWVDIVQSARDELIAYAYHKQKIYAETNNRLTFMAPALSMAFPASKFIHLHRHPYEVIRSGMRRGWYDGDKLDNFKITPQKDDPLHAKWSSLNALEKNAWHWAEVNRFSMNFINTLSENRALEIPAARLFACDMQTIRAMFSFIGVSVPKEKKIRRSLKRTLNAQRKGNYPTIEQWSKEIKDIIKEILGVVPESLGYHL